jgi:hypothetical protein
VEALNYRESAQYKIKAKALKILRSKLWARVHMKDHNEYIYDLDTPYPDELILHRKKI